MTSKKLETIEELWTDFAASVMPHIQPGTPSYHSIRAFFFTGAFGLFQQISNLPDHNTHVAAEYMVAVNKELTQFMDDMRHKMHAKMRERN